jgi:hypothetical protein
MLIGCAGTENPGASDPKCQLNTQGEKTPGFPYAVDKFKSDVVPVLVASCLGSGCHSSPTGQGSFTVWADAATDSCNLAQTFNSTITKIDLLAPNNSRLTAVVSGGSTTHPKLLTATDADKASLTKLTAFITAAKAAKDAADGGSNPAGPGNSVFDYAIFQSQIQPALTAATCAVEGCHLTGGGGFYLKANPAPNSAEMEFNFGAVTTRTKFDPPEGSTIYVRATMPHNGGTSRQVSAAGAAQLLAWITAAKTANGGSGGGGNQPGCAPADSFNLGVFRTEILPIISGRVDLNVPGGQGRGAGCQSSECHGDTTRGPGTLVMGANDDPAKVLSNFACFVNLDSPSESEIVKCPLNQTGCRKYPNHPGQAVFRDGADKNYQRFLAFIYGAKAARSPHDFAFYARKIDPIFSDPTIVLADGQGLTCGSFQGCHGVNGAGQSPPGGSDFPIIPNAGEVSLTFNFIAATGFVSFLDPLNSSLFLYPTDEISKIGPAHPGGPILAVNSQQALDILTWARGLRPNANGFALNWLLLGDFATNLINDSPLFNESTVIPKLFQQDGGQFNLGKWEGEFSASEVIDLTKQFQNKNNRTAYAAVNLLNTDPFLRKIQLLVSSPNAVAVFVDGQLRSQSNVGGVTPIFMTVGGAGSKTPLPTARIMIKLFQSNVDQQFQFTAQFQDDQGNVLNDQNSGLVFTLGPDGGI